MSNFRQIAEHYYEQVSSQMQGMVGEAFHLQKADLLGHIAATIEDSGPQMAASQLNALANFSQTYNGRNNPYLGDVFSGMKEMIDKGINPGTSEWQSQVRNMGEQHLFRTAGVNSDGSAKVYDNAADNVAAQVSHPLAQALAHHKDLLAREAGPYQDPNEILRLEKTIRHIESDIQKLNPNPVSKTSAPDKPQLSPEAQARQQAEDKAVMHSLDRFEAQQRSAGDDQVGLIDPAENLDGDFDFDDGDGEDWD